MRLKEYLKTLDCFVITTNFNKSRYDRTKSDSEELFKSISPYYAHDVSDPVVELEYANMFREGSKKLEQSIKDLKTGSLKHKSLVDFGTKSLTSKNVTKYARTESLFLTHLDILRKSIVENKTIVILEDDAHLRREVIEYDIELPEEFDILILGGQTNHKTDNKQFADMIVPVWGRVTNTMYNGHGAYATVYTPYGAMKTIEALEKLHTHLDYARKPALCEWTNTKKIVPDLFTVRGTSVRDLGIKEDCRAITREEARKQL